MKENIYTSGKYWIFFVFLICFSTTYLHSSAQGNRLGSQQVNLGQSQQRNLYQSRPPVHSPATSGNRQLAQVQRNALGAISAEYVNGAYNISWESVTDRDLRNYQVEFSYNNRDFERAGDLTPSDRAVYFYRHVVKPGPQIHYRIRMTDLNGNISYSSVVSLNRDYRLGGDFLAPTIVRDGVLHVSISGVYKDLRLVNGSGIEVYRSYLGGRTGNRISFTLPELPAGTYYVRLIGSDRAITRRVLLM